MSEILLEGDASATPIWPVSCEGRDAWLADRLEVDRAWLSATDFKAEAGEIRLVPAADGTIAGVALGLGVTPDLWTFGALADALPEGLYRFVGLDDALATAAASGWLLGAYAFTRYKDKTDSLARLVRPEAADGEHAKSIARAAGLARDLINTPAEDMGPEQLAAAAMGLAGAHDAEGTVTVGDDLLAGNLPTIHAVGRAATRAPRLIDFQWGAADAPKLTLVGKGVCFDTGGLNLKPSNAMLRMKKDMGGAANVLGLASLIMDARLPVRLRVLIPAVENAVAGNAFRPGDVIRTRKGLTVEIGNTDSEGRLVLCDALALGDEEAPELMIDMATLTGAARVALGADLPAMFTDDDALAETVARHAGAQSDPLWRLPLHQPYAEELKSPVADLNNVSEGAMAGAVTAALYLKSFVESAGSWMHLDMYAWNDRNRPGRPRGGEAQTIRGLLEVIRERYA